MTMKHLCRAGALALLLLLALIGPPAAAPFLGFSPCTGNPPASLSVSNVSANVQLSTCAPTVIVWNVGTTEVFFILGATSSTVATASGNSLPASAWIVLNVGEGGLWFAAITAASTSTLRFVQGSAES